MGESSPTNSGNRRSRRHPPRWATTKQVAAHLEVTTRAVERMGAEGRLTKYRLGSRIVRYDLNEVDDALLQSDREK